ncbi:excinuclease ABC subunit C [Candidatus Saccharibacteria bacterium]|nr:MAG: excinuclease ABC subunit C [Candidatus Saccharibacteria bacterium]
MNSQLQKKLESLPRSAGVYFHKSASGEVIYVGKAAVLKNRVRQYFQDSRSRDNKTMALVAEIADVDWIETDSEVDALFLESEMVKRYMPRYNILLRDDKSQIYVRIDMKSQWPTVTFTRNPGDDGAEYIGPFYSAYALKKALRYLRRAFPYLTKKPKYSDSKLEQQIGLVPDVLRGNVEYKKNLRQLISYIKGNRKSLVVEIEREMKLAARQQRFEDAAILRNKVRALSELQRRVCFSDREFMDISKDRALNDLMNILGLESIPIRIEGYDISHMSGRNVVASMVVFSNGASDRSEYRKFKVSEKNDDTGNIYEVILRRLSPLNLKKWGQPSLLLVDGGKGQLAAAIKARDERQQTVPIISIAKREEEIVIDTKGSGVKIDYQRLGDMVSKDGEYMVINLHPDQRNAGSHSKNLRSGEIGRYDDVTKLFQRMRDEAHRFAISYHTSLKRQRQTDNSLENIPGVGPKTRQKLLKKFGSIKAIKKAEIDQLADVVGPKKAKDIKNQLKD